MKHINVLIPDGEFPLSYNVVACLRNDARFNVFVFSTKEDTPYNYSTLISGYRHKEHLKYSNAWNTCIESLIKEWSIDIVFPVNPETQRWISASQPSFLDHVKVPLQPCPDLHDAVDNKSSMTQLQSKIGIPILSTYSLNDIQDITETRLPFPVLIKPTIGLGGEAIRRCDTPDEFSSIRHDYPDPENWIVQPYIQGRVSGGSFLARQGKILRSTTFVEYEIRPKHSYSAGKYLIYQDIPDIHFQLEKIADTLKWDGVMQCDFITCPTQQQHFLLDANPRYWRNVATCLHIGINYPVLHCLDALGDPLPENKPTPNLYSNNLYSLRDAAPFLKHHLKGLLKGSKYKSNISHILNDPRRYLSRHINGTKKLLKRSY